MKRPTELEVTVHHTFSNREEMLKYSDALHMENLWHVANMRKLVLYTNESLLAVHAACRKAGLNVLRDNS